MGQTERIPKWKIKLWTMLCVMAVFSFWGAFYGIYLQSSLQLAVKHGIATLNNVTLFAWGSCAIFASIVIFIYHIEIYNTLSSMIQTFKWLCVGCSINKETETRFFTPKWQLDD